MRIAFFTDTYLPNTDAVVTWIVSYRKELEKMGHEVYIFTPGSREQKKKNRDTHVYYFTSAQFSKYPDYRLALVNVFSPLKSVNDSNIDIIHVHGVATTGLVAVKTAAQYHIPIIASFHTIVPDAVHYLSSNKSINDILSTVAWKYLRWYYRHFEKILVPTEYVLKMLKDNRITNTQVEPIGIHVKAFLPKKGDEEKINEVRKKYKIPKVRKIVLYVGRITKEKNIDLIITSAHNILNINKNIMFVIVGRGPYLKDLKRLAESEGISKSIVFTGYVPTSDLRYLYKCADVLAFPSEFDTFGLVTLEAMASGLPVVARKGTAPDELIDDGKNGYLFNDTFDFPEKILKTIKDKKKLSEDAIKTAEKYGIKNSVSRLVMHYNSTIKTNEEIKKESSTKKIVVGNEKREIKKEYKDKVKK